MDEYVSRELVKERFKKRLNWLKKDIHDEYSSALYDCCEYDTNLIDEIPAADVALVRYGRWEWFDEDVGTPVTGYEREWGWRCSNCGEELSDDYDDPDDSPTFRFCYNCGAKMDGGNQNV